MSTARGAVQSNRLSNMELVTLLFDPKCVFVLNFHRYHSKVKKRDTVFRFVFKIKDHDCVETLNISLHTNQLRNQF